MKPRDHNCPECGDPIVSTEGKNNGACIGCGWSESLDDAAIDTSSPFDVEARQPFTGEENGEVLVRLSKTSQVRLSPQKAESFAEALEQAARDAKGHRDPEDSYI